MTKTCRGCTHIYNTVQLSLIFLHYTHGPGSWTLQEREKAVNKWTGARAATAGPCCSCQQDSLAACKHVVTMMILAHMEGTGAKQNELNGGKNVEEGSGYGRQRVDRHTACRTGTAGKHSRRALRPAQASKQMASSWPASQQKQQLPTKLACLSPCSAGRWGECSGAGSQEGGRRPTYRPDPTYRLCLSLSLPTPLICTKPI